jgi:hypothetical protein
LPRDAAIIGHGPHGPVVEGLQDRWAEAIAWLKAARTGDIRGLLAHRDVPGRIDAIWGDHNPQTDVGYGLAHIDVRHPEVLPDLPERLARMRLAEARGNKRAPGTAEWSVKTAGVYRADFFKNKELLWSRPGPDGSPPSGGSPFNPGGQSGPNVAGGAGGFNAPGKADLAAIPKVRHVRTGGRGPRARAPEFWSLFEFIASRGGIDPTDRNIGDVRALLGTSNKFVPGFGHLIRKNGLKLDTMREAAVEAGYLQDAGEHGGGLRTSTINDLLDAMDRELRGQRVYRQGVEPPIGKAELAHRRQVNREYIENQIVGELKDQGIEPADVPDKTMARVVEMLEREGETDAISAYERAVMEEIYYGAEAGEHERIPDVLPGWDVPDDAGAAPPPGGAPARGGQPLAGAAVRDAGGGDREAPGARGRADFTGLTQAARPEDAADAAASRAAEKAPEPAGAERIRFVKRFEGRVVCYVEEVRTGKRGLAFKTMWKRAGADEEGAARRPSEPRGPEGPTSETGRATAENVVASRQNANWQALRDAARPEEAADAAASRAAQMLACVRRGFGVIEAPEKAF